MIRIPKQIRQNAHPFLVIFATLYIAFVFCPVYIARADQLPLDGTLLTLITVGILAASTVACAILSLSKVNYRYVEPVLTATLLLFFIFATIVPRQVAMLDGQELTGKVPPNWYWTNLLAWLLLLLVAWKLRHRLRFVAVPILLLCGGYTLYERLHYGSASGPNLTTEEVLKHKHALGTLSSKQNVVVLAVDMLQGSIVEKVLNENPATLSAFDGFTVFTRALTSFPFTNFSKPAILSGKTYATRDSGTVVEHWKAAEQDSFATDLLDRGYTLNSIDFVSFGKNARRLSVSSSDFLGEDTTKLSHAAYFYGYAFAAGLARITGVWPTNPFFGEARDYMLTPKLKSVAVARELSQLIRREDGIPPRALLFWNLTAHAPVALDREGTVSEENAEDEAAIKEETLLVFDQLASLFNSMKTADVYDNSLIVVVSDHGHPMLATKEHLQDLSGLENGFETGGNYVPVSVYNATLWIKPPFARDPAVIVREPAWNGDVRSVISSYLGDFANRDPRGLLRDIRKANPDIEILYLRHVQANPQYSSEAHKLVKARSIETLYDVFIGNSKKKPVGLAPRMDLQ